MRFARTRFEVLEIENLSMPGSVRRSDVCVLNVPSGHIRTCAAVRGSTTLYCEQAYKDFLIFSQSHKTSPGLMRFARTRFVTLGEN